jgi:adenylate cyclase
MPIWKVPPPLSGNFGGYAKADTEGVQFFLDYRNAEPNFTIVSMFDVLDGKIDPDLMRNRIVLNWHYSRQ